MSENQEFDLLRQRITELTAAVEELNFECEKLQILNSNLEIQLAEANRELSRNIILLEGTQKENERLICETEQMRSKAVRSEDLGNIIENVQDYATDIIAAAHLAVAPNSDSMGDRIYVNQINDLLGKLSSELDKASKDIGNQ